MAASPDLPPRGFDDDDLETAWRTHYRPRPDTRQMDLFIDNVEAALVKGIAGALVARQGEEADRLITRLHSHNPQSPAAQCFRRAACGPASILRLRASMHTML